MAVKFEREPIAQFLDQLPGLILQYQQAKIARDERALEREYRDEARQEAREWQIEDRDIRREDALKLLELQSSQNLLNENRKLYSEAKSSLDKLEQKYGEAVGGIENLPEMYKSSGLDITTEIYKGDATNYQERANVALNNMQAAQNKINVLQDVIYTDIKRTQNIMAGGAGFEGGEDPQAVSHLQVVLAESRFSFQVLP